ncbi:hypothetical protein M422DRAFT_216084 [Sphaerobolus stellatus SS14]|uniref:WHIM1 domain-containing protein n=1 Tax=Sphaerobolus stellatus (strain SS14) TaxID=990650 RepID=A0A0C9TYL3_SPHS4|nr:hypothetical protein M422DRAFT_216084 [Sphaerobolus stellatus SS14]
MQDSSLPEPRKTEVKKGHVCPPSKATHPADRWETAFVYTFITKFTKLKQEVDGLETVEDLEEALLFNGPHPILEQLLARLMRYLRPQTRNVGPDIISNTVAAYFVEVYTRGERTSFWNETLNANEDPFAGGDYFQLNWDTKLRILRQLVEWVLCYSVEIKGVIDRAWGIVHMKHKKSNVEIAQEAQELPDTDPFSRKNIVTIPLGQDAKKIRYWALDDSPRLYVSTNPWKVTADFTKRSTTKEEYLGVIEELKSTAPTPPKEGEKRSKSEMAHLALITTLESRLEVVEAEVQRIAKARKKFLQKQMAQEQVAEMNLRGTRNTRTRRSTRKADYVYYDGDEEEEGEDFIDTTYDEKVEDEADFINDEPLSEEEEYEEGYGRSRRPRRAAAAVGTERRRSTRSAVTNGNGNRNGEWRGERRSTRLGAASNQSLELPPAKRRRTVGSATPSLPDDQMDVDSDPANPTILRANEVALPAVEGKKRSKFWFYAVEPNPNAAAAPLPEPGASGSTNGNANGTNGGPGEQAASTEDVKQEDIKQQQEPPSNGMSAEPQAMKLEPHDISVKV